MRKHNVSQSIIMMISWIMVIFLVSCTFVEVSSSPIGAPQGTVSALSKDYEEAEIRSRIASPTAYYYYQLGAKRDMRAPPTEADFAGPTRDRRPGPGP